MGIYVTEGSSHYREQIQERLDRFKCESPSRVVEFRTAREASAKRILDLWCPAMDLFDGIILEVHGIGAKFFKRHRARGIEEDDPIFKVLAILHARACSVTSDVRALLVTGHGFGASAHSRTLQEIAVVSSLIREYDPDVAQRYIDHEVIDAFKAASEYNEVTKTTTAPPLDINEFTALTKEKDDLIDKYGKSFASTYGWAAKLLGNSRPTYRDLQKAAGLDDVQSVYTRASHLVHAAALGTSQYLHHEDTTTTLLSGPRSWGLAQPASETLYALTLITNRFISLAEREPYDNDSTTEDVATFVLQALVQEATDSFSAIEQNLRTKELDTRKSAENALP